MWEYVNSVFMVFCGCFSRKAAFHCFVVIIVGFMLRSDYAGISSIIRTLALMPVQYENLVHFFRSSAWSLLAVKKQWIRFVGNSGVLFTEDGMPILIGDGVKQSKEARKMPGVKRLHQESENSGKAEYIFGHMFGAIGVLVGNIGKLFCLPLSVSLHDGDELIRKWDNENYEPVSHVVQIIRDAFSAAVTLGNSILLLDAYFFTVPLLKEMAKQALELGIELSVVVRAKISAVAYTLPIPHNGRGRPRKKGERIKLRQLFETAKENFIQAKVWLYGQEETIEYLCKDLLWGSGLYILMRFVLVKSGDKKLILVSTNLSFTPDKILCLYGYRFKIEVTFRTLKQLLGAFSYHFWSMSMPRLNRFTKKGEKDPLLEVKSKNERARILEAFSAIERYVMMELIANGILQLLSLKYSSILEKSSFCWLRTISSKVVSEATMCRFLRKDFFLQFHKMLHLPILQIIHSKLESKNDSNLPGAA
jgi:hypothetical protein